MDGTSDDRDDEVSVVSDSGSSEPGAGEDDGKTGGAAAPKGMVASDLEEDSERNS